MRDVRIVDTEVVTAASVRTITPDATSALSAQVDEQVFGHRVAWRGNFAYRADVLGDTQIRDLVADCYALHAVVPDYATDTEAALDALAETGGIATLRRVKVNEWHVTLDSVSPHGWWAETLPLAICRALLAAVSASASSDSLAAVREAETECHAEERADG